MTAGIMARVGALGAVTIMVAALLAATAVFSWLAVSELSTMVDTAVATAKGERDAQWKFQIAEANRKVAEATAEQLRHAQQVDAEARAEVENVQKQLTELEKANEALPDSDGGIRRGRVRLLNQQ
jgi:flagellar motility protein MotE (MotC chaperone)